ncbi:MAG: universal stress protein [Acidobacteriota bacterium]|nr:universal stress protein [Acidobacteriota bacterium]
MKVKIMHILWATDFSDEAGNALKIAQAFAKAFGARLTALHVVPDYAPLLHEVVAAQVADFSRRVRELRKATRKKIETEAKRRRITFKDILVESGSAPKKIVETAEKKKADLIVIGRKGLSAMEKVFVGSVANQVLRASSVPVLMTGGGKPRASFKKILVPTDFSVQEEIERDYAWALAGAFGADLTLLHVLELHEYSFSPRELQAVFDDVLGRLKKRKARTKGSFQVREDVTRAVNAAGGIVEYAERKKSDLIVMSTCTEGFLQRFFLGSNTEKVIAYAGIPVFAIPAAFCKV